MIRAQKNFLAPGVRVAWIWDGRTVEGVIRKVFTHRLERTMNGSTVTRAADKRNPAYLIEQDGGLNILINHSQLQLAA